MKDFADLLALALVGTARGTLSAPAPSALAETLNAVQGDSIAADPRAADPERILLGRAALAGMVRSAGRVAAPLPAPLPEPAPAEHLPEVPPRFARHLTAVMQTPLLAEWLALCAQGGWRVPPASLPALLDLTRQNAALRDPLRPVLGERAAWLAHLNPEWRFVPAPLTEDAWASATEAQKESQFRALRADDPARARELLSEHFKTEKVGTRRRLLQVLADTLTPEDQALEPLLEAALMDRSSEVRVAVQAVLLRLPHSAYNARMVGRVAAMLPEQLGGKKPPALRPPGLLDEAAQRDGVPPPDERPKNPALSHFRALLRWTNPGVLAGTLGLSAAGLVELAHRLNSLDQLQEVTLNTAHQPTAGALLPHFPENLALLVLAQPDALAEHVRRELRQEPLDTGRLLTLLDELPHTWPAPLSEEVLALTRRRVGQLGKNSDIYRWESVLELLGERADPHISLPPPLPAEQTDHQAHYSARYIQRKFDETLTLLRRRAELRKDFAAASQESEQASR